MNLSHIQDADLLTQIKNFVQAERDVLVKIIHHLREVERRRLFSDLGYKSLFDYAVGELRYSEGQAGRRIQAMRLLRDLPGKTAGGIEAKISAGKLSLSNVQQAQSFFREAQAAEPRRIISVEEKLDVLERLENKSVRDGQKELLRLNPSHALPKERERIIADEVSEIRFLMSDALKAKLEGVRALLGPRGAMMTYADLIDVMSDLSLSTLEAKQFGKQRVNKAKQTKANLISDDVSKRKNTALPLTPVVAGVETVAVNSANSMNPRYIPKSMKHHIWQRDRGSCVNCGSRRNINYDHIRPVAHGGASTPENLRLLCFQCNQRASARVFGGLYA